MPPDRPLDALRDVDVRALAERLGYATARGGYTPCPVCRAETRGGRDRRAPWGVTPRGLWHCWCCEASGDGVALLAATVTGAVKPPDWRPVVEAARDLAGVPVPKARPRRRTRLERQAAEYRVAWAAALAGARVRMVAALDGGHWPTWQEALATELAARSPDFRECLPLAREYVAARALVGAW